MYCKIYFFYNTERYRSGHNEPHSDKSPSQRQRRSNAGTAFRRLSSYNLILSRKGIEVVITSRTRNAVVDFSAHGFESHSFRHGKPKPIFWFRFFVCGKWWTNSNPSFDACVIVTQWRCIPFFPPNVT